MNPDKKYFVARVYPWEEEQYFEVGNSELGVGDWIVVRTGNNNQEAAVISSLVSEAKEGEEFREYSYVRAAVLEDLKVIKENNKKKSTALVDCKKMVKRLGLPMKLVDSFFSFDAARLTFTFTADSRVDFRELVKELTKHFQKSIRLQQIGSRDETKQLGQLGQCGRTICCKSFLNELGNITTDLARVQNIEQRGSDRLSGVCSRLKCCLGYEAEGYEAYGKKLPKVGQRHKTKSGETGDVISQNILKHSVNIRSKDGSIVTDELGCSRVGCSGCKCDIK